jgi:hypothetical protein
MVPRTRDGEVCCASADIDEIATIASAASGRRVGRSGMG